MGFTQLDGTPLLTWREPEDAFNAWRECSRGRPCDYTGLSYEKLRGGSGIPWPCNDEHPDGTVRLYRDGVFSTDPGYCETYGHDLLTGATVGPQAYKAASPAGRAVFKTAAYQPAHETPDDEYPYRYTTGRTVYHFHTRTKTGRSPQLNSAAPEVWVEMSVNDAAAQELDEGDVVRVESRRGFIAAPVRISDIRDGTVFAPFHYGYWDQDGAPDGKHRAANELTITEWDPVSKQPVLKNAAVKVTKIADGSGPSLAPTTTASRPAGRSKGRGRVLPTAGGPAAQATETIAPVEPPAAATKEERA
jgi:anaerobic selenocysteine-containing dehydrogenase